MKKLARAVMLMLLPSLDPPPDLNVFSPTELDLQHRRLIVQRTAQHSITITFPNRFLIDCAGSTCHICEGGCKNWQVVTQLPSWSCQKFCTDTAYSDASKFPFTGSKMEHGDAGSPLTYYPGSYSFHVAANDSFNWDYTPFVITVQCSSLIWHKGSQNFGTITRKENQGTISVYNIHSMFYNSGGICSGALTSASWQVFHACCFSGLSTNMTVSSGMLMVNTANPGFNYNVVNVWVKGTFVSTNWTAGSVQMILDCATHPLWVTDAANPAVYYVNNPATNMTVVQFLLQTPLLMTTDYPIGCTIAYVSLHDDLPAKPDYSVGKMSLLNDILTMIDCYPGKHTVWVKGKFIQTATPIAYKKLEIICPDCYGNPGAYQTVISLNYVENRGVIDLGLASALFNTETINQNTGSLFYCPINLYTVYKTIVPLDTTATQVTLVGSPPSLQLNTTNPLFMYTYSVWLRAKSTAGLTTDVEIRVALVLDCNSHLLSPLDPTGPLSFIVLQGNSTAIDLYSLQNRLLVSDNPMLCKEKYLSLHNDDATKTLYSSGTISMENSVITMLNMTPASYILYLKGNLGTATAAPAVAYQKLNITVYCKDEVFNLAPGYIDLTTSENAGLMNFMTAASLFLQSASYCPIATYSVLMSRNPDNYAFTPLKIISGNVNLNTSNPTFNYSTQTNYIKAQTMTVGAAYVTARWTLTLNCSTHSIVPLNATTSLNYSVIIGTPNNTAVDFQSLNTRVLTTDYPTGCPETYVSLHDDVVGFPPYSGGKMILNNQKIQVTDMTRLSNYSVAIKAMLPGGIAVNHQRLIISVECPSNPAQIFVAEPSTLHLQRASFVTGSTNVLTLVLPYLNQSGSLTFFENDLLNVTTETPGCGARAVQAFTTVGRTVNASTPNYNSYVVSGTTERNQYGFLRPSLTFEYGPNSPPQTMYLTYYGVVNKLVQIDVKYCQDIDPILPQGTNNSLLLHEKPQFEVNDTLDFTNTLIPYNHTLPWCRLTESLVSANDSIYVPYNNTVANMTATHKILANTNNSPNVYTFFLFYRPVQQNNLFWTKKINFTIYKNCSHEVFRARLILETKLQRNDKNGSIYVLKKNVSDLFEQNREDPLCIIKDWDLLDLNGTEIKAASDLYLRTGQTTRVDPLMQLQFNQTYMGLDELVFNFTLRVFLRDLKTGPWVYPHPEQQTVNIVLGCYKLNKLDVKLKDFSLQESEDFTFGKFIREEYDVELDGNVTINLFRVFVQKYGFYFQILDLYEVVEFVTDYSGCGPDQVLSYSNINRTQLVPEKYPLRLNSDPSYVNRTSGLVNFNLNVSTTRSLSGSDTIYLKGRHLNEETQQTIEVNFALEIIQCVDVPMPANLSIYQVETKLIKNRPLPEWTGKTMFTLNSFDLCAGETYFINNDLLLLEPQVIDGVKINSTTGELWMNVTQSQRNYVFYVHKYLTRPRSTAAIPFNVTVVPLILTLEEPFLEMHEVNVTINSTTNNIIEGKMYKYTSPKFDPEGNATLSTMMTGDWPKFCSFVFNKKDKTLSLSVNRTSIRESATYEGVFLFWTENSEKQELKITIVIKYTPPDKKQGPNNNSLITDKSEFEKESWFETLSGDDVASSRANTKISLENRKFLKMFLSSGWNVPKKSVVGAKPILMKLDLVSREGEANLVFNQRLIVPPFVDVKGNSSDNMATHNKTEKRVLLPLSEIDMSQMLDINLKLNQDIPPEKLSFVIELLEWTPTNLKIKMNFDDPELISRGIKPDKMILTIMTPKLFVSEESTIQLKNYEAHKKKVLPRQMPKGVSEKEVGQTAALVANTIKGLIFAQILLQNVIKKHIEKMFVMFFTLQVIAYSQIYSIQLPSSASIYMDQFTNLVELRVAEPDNIIQAITGDDQVTWLSYFGFDKYQKQAEDTSKSLLESFSVIIFFLLILVIVVTLAYIIQKVPCIKGKIKEKAKDFIHKTAWTNDNIRGLTMSYIKIANDCSVQIHAYFIGTGTDDPQTANEQIVAAVQFFLLFGYIIGTHIILMRNKFKLEDEKVQFNYSNLYIDIKLYDWKTGKPNLLNLSYNTIWLARRLLFVALPLFLHNFSIFPLQLMILSQTFYIIFYQHARPHTTTLRVRTEIVNEIFIMVSMYHMVIFTEMTIHPMMQFQAGYSFAFNFVAVIIFNTPPIILGAWKDYQFNKKKKQREKELEKLKGGPKSKLPPKLQNIINLIKEKAEKIKASKTKWKQLTDLKKLSNKKLQVNQNTVALPKLAEVLDGPKDKYVELQDAPKTPEINFARRQEEDPANVITGMERGFMKVNNISLSDTEKEDLSMEDDQQPDLKDSKKQLNSKFTSPSSSTQVVPQSTQKLSKTDNFKGKVLESIQEDVMGENFQDLETIKTRKIKKTKKRKNKSKRKEAELLDEKDVMEEEQRNKTYNQE